MDSETVLIGIGIIGLVGLVLWRLWLKMKPDIMDALADGELTVGEALEIISEHKDEIEEAIDEIEALVPSKSELQKMKKADLVALAEEKGLDVSGTKDAIIKRLLE